MCRSAGSRAATAYFIRHGGGGPACLPLAASAADGRGSARRAWSAFADHVNGSSAVAAMTATTAEHPSYAAPLLRSQPRNERRNFRPLIRLHRLRPPRVLPLAEQRL